MSSGNFLGDRIFRLRNLLEERNIDALFLSSAESKIHFGDMLDIEGYLIVFRNRAIILTDPRFFNESKKYQHQFEVLMLNTPLFSFIKNEKILSGMVVGIETTDLSYRFVRDFVQNTGTKSIEDVSDVLSAIISIADQEFIRRMKKAISISGKAYSNIAKKLKPGISEKELAIDLSFAQTRLGSQKDSFNPIVAFYKNCGNPHHHSTAKTLKKNENVLLDFGAVYKGVHSDITRMKINARSDRSKEIYSILKFIHEEIKLIAFPGVPVAELDLLARKILEKNGLIEGVKHSLGHGLGYKVHQSPRISIHSNEFLIGNQVITIEPGVYFKNSGYRYEDDYLVTGSGLINLSKNIPY